MIQSLTTSRHVIIVSLFAGMEVDFFLVCDCWVLAHGTFGIKEVLARKKEA